MNILFLDDDLYRTKAFRSVIPSATCVDSADDCINKLVEQWDIVLLDHDLGDTKDGRYVANWISANKPIIGKIIVHSLNYPAAQEMLNILDTAGYSVAYRNFLDLKLNNFDIIH